jgi:ADP-ribose pyrophosphatase YjhB (NUDIX family)
MLLRAHNSIFDTPRARVVVLNEHNEILLTRSWTGVQKWELPGGGVERKEDPKAAAKRELREETGIDMPLETFRFAGVIGQDYTAHIFAVEVTRSALPADLHNPWEITAAAWYPIESLPETTPLAAWAIEIVSKMR